jgi:hypothetical protein
MLVNIFDKPSGSFISDLGLLVPVLLFHRRPFIHVISITHYEQGEPLHLIQLDSLLTIVDPELAEATGTTGLFYTFIGAVFIRPPSLSASYEQSKFHDRPTFVTFIQYSNPH